MKKTKSTTHTNTESISVYLFTSEKREYKNLPPLAGGLGLERSETLEQ